MPGTGTFLPQGLLSLGRDMRTTASSTGHNNYLTTVWNDLVVFYDHRLCCRNQICHQIPMHCTRWLVPKLDATILHNPPLDFGRPTESHRLVERALHRSLRAPSIVGTTTKSPHLVDAGLHSAHVRRAPVGQVLEAHPLVHVRRPLNSIQWTNKSRSVQTP